MRTKKTTPKEEDFAGKQITIFDVTKEQEDTENKEQEDMKDKQKRIPKTFRELFSGLNGGKIIWRED